MLVKQQTLTFTQRLHLLYSQQVQMIFATIRTTISFTLSGEKGRGRVGLKEA